jgi:probable rRNA maturation factor
VRVLFRNSQKALEVQADSVVRLTEFILQQEGASQKEVSILFTDDSEITRLNAKHLGRDIPTDVLAFPMNDSGAKFPHLEILGDVVVSVERALSSADEHGLRRDEEVTLYLIHGLLHLLGYDDIDPNKSKIMKRREGELLRKARESGLIVRSV